MKNNGTSISPRFGYGIVMTVLVAALFVIIALLVQVNTLKGQVATYESEAVKRSAQLSAYRQLACSGIPQVTKANSVQTYELDVNGTLRTYRIHTPIAFDPSLRYPVVFSFDGIDGSGAQMESYAGLDTLPALIVYPDSLPSKEGFTAWQGAPYSKEGVDDIAFVRRLIETLPGSYCIDSTAIFAAGMSNGGAFATIVGCELGTTIRAVASISGAYYSTCKNETRTPSLLVLHSVDDNRVPYYGEVARGLPDVPRWIRAQSTARSCDATLRIQNNDTSKQYTWYGCKDGSILRFTVLNGQAHGWLRVPTELQKGTPTTAKYIWDFFETVR